MINFYKNDGNASQRVETAVKIHGIDLKFLSNLPV